MGKTVKSRTIMSIVSFALVLVFCVAANSSIPGLYESYKQRVVAQEAASKEAEEVKKPQEVNKGNVPAQQTTTTPDASDTSADDMSSEDTSIYDVPEETPVTEDVPAEETDENLEDFDFDFDFGDNDKDNDGKESKGGFFDIIFSLVKSLFEKISNLKIFKFLKDLFVGFLGLFGIKL